MKMVFLLGLFLTTTLLSFGQTEVAASDQKASPKRVQRVKVVMKQDGKEVKIDTTFNFADEKVIQMKIDSMLERQGIKGDRPGDPHVVIMRGGNKMRLNHHAGSNFPGEEQFEVFCQSGDTTGMKCEKKIICVGKGSHAAAFDADGDMIPPPPPPPVPPFLLRSFKINGGDPFAMDPNDRDIISYDKKDIGKGLEKITIVRKKHNPGEEAKEIQMKVEVSDDQKK